MDWEEFRENEENEHLFKFLDKMRADYVERAFYAAVEVLGQTDSSDIPAPNTEHPGLIDQARFIREKNKPHVVIMQTPRITAIGPAYDNEYIKPETYVPIKKHILARTWCTGPAPFVGDPIWEDARYFWPMWKDDLGRFVTGDSALEWDLQHWDLRRRDKPTRDYPH